MSASLLALTAATPALAVVDYLVFSSGDLGQPYGLNIPSAGALDFGQVNPATGAFTVISHLPNGLALPLTAYAANPIVGEYYLPVSGDTLAIDGQSGASRALSSNLTVLGFDVANDRLIAASLDGTGSHIVSIDPVTLTQTQKSPAFAPPGQMFASAAAAVNSISREVYTLGSGNTLLVTNLDTGAAIRSITLSQNVAATFAFDPLNGTLYDFVVPSAGDFRLASIDPATGHVSVISAANVLSGGIANQGRSLSIAAGAIYVQSLGGVYDIVDLATGTLKSSFTSAAYTIFPQDQIVLGGASDSTFAFNITNPNAALYKVGSGTVTLTGANSYAGTTNILAGTLVDGDSSLHTGNYVDNGTLRISSLLGSRYSGNISGTGGVTIATAGGIQFAGNNTYSGTTLVQTGFLNAETSSAFSPNSDYVVQQGGTLNAKAVVTIGSLSGNGALLSSNGAGFRIGANGKDTAFSGSYADDLSFAPATLEKIGTGTLTLVGANTYRGSTTVSAGTLSVTGSTASSAVSVANGARLAGTGTVGAVTVASGGTLSPGAGGVPGTLTVQGNLALASGASYGDAISPTAASLTNVGGTANIGGALSVNLAAGTYTIGQRYTVLSAASGLSGTFSSVSTTGSNVYRAFIGYDANSTFITLGPNALAPLLPPGIGGNGLNAIKAVDAAIAGGATVNSGFNALFGLSGAGLGSAVAQLPGEAGADAAQAGSQAFVPFMSLLTAEGTSGSPTLTAANFAPGVAYGEDGAPKPAQAATGGMRAWGTVFARHTGIAADPIAGTQSVRAGNTGFAAGIEMQVSDNLRLGAAAGVGHGSFSAGNGRGASDDAMLGLYGSLGVMDQGYVAGAVSYGWHDVDTLRRLTVSGTDLLAAKYTAHDVGLRIEGGWRVALGDADALVPYAAIAWNSYGAPAYGEHAVSGSSDFALSYAARDTDFGQSELGLKAGRTIAMGGDTMAMELSAAWAHQLYGAPFALAAFQAFPGSSFVVQGGRIARDTALLGAGLDWRARDGLSFGARIDSQLGGGTTALAGTGTVSLRW